MSVGIKCVQLPIPEVMLFLSGVIVSLGRRKCYKCISVMCGFLPSLAQDGFGFRILACDFSFLGDSAMEWPVVTLGVWACELFTL